MRPLGVYVAVGRREVKLSDVCECWSHLKCMGMKEGVGILEEKKFVCHFCLSACVMELRWEVKGLREELDGVTDKLKVASKENEKLKRQTEQTERKGPERVRRALNENRTGSMTGGEKVSVIVWVRQLCQARVKSQQCVTYTPKLRKAIGRETGGRTAKLIGRRNQGRQPKRPQVYGRRGGLEKRCPVVRLQRKWLEHWGKYHIVFL